MNSPKKPNKIDEALDRYILLSSRVRRAQSSLKWGAISFLLLSILMYHLFYHDSGHGSKWHSLECIATGLLCLNTLYHVCYYLWVVLDIEPISLNAKQKKLLGVKDSDFYVKDATSNVASPNKSVIQDGDKTPLNLTALSWRSLSMMSPAPVNSNNESSMTSPNYSMSSPSWVYQSGTPDASLRSRQGKGSPNKSLTSHIPATPPSEFIRDEDSLNDYLHHYEAHEKSSVQAASVEQPTNLLSSFWSHPASRSPADVSPMLRRCTYQLSPHSPAQSPSSPGAVGDDTGSPSAIHQNREVWRRFKIDSNMLAQWNSNLRMWISKTIMERLVTEMENVDAALGRQSISDVRIGQVGLERLRKTARTVTVVQNIPTLPYLVPFLELTPHQEYLVNRIKELSKGVCMTEFRWNSGGSYNGKPWEEHLPTDAALVMHVLATYLDSQLLPRPQHPDGRPFSSQYFYKAPEKPVKSPCTLAIYQSCLSPPHYVLIVGDDTLDVGKGRNNLFHTVLLFLHMVKTREHGMLGRVNMGPSGINILWVINSTNTPSEALNKILSK